MWVLKNLRLRGNAKKSISVFLCVIFIVFCTFLMIIGFKWPHVWAIVYSIENSEKSGVLVFYLFASSLLVVSFLLILALKNNGSKAILSCLLGLVALWQVHLVICFMSLVVHTMNLQEEFKTVVALYKTLPLLCVQGLWLYFIWVVWYYWRELTLLKDVPAFLHSLRINARRRKAMQQDQRDRLGELPRRLMSQLIPQVRGLTLADAS